MKKKIVLLVLIVGMLASALAGGWAERRGLGDVAAHAWPEEPAPPHGALTATWFGTTAVLLDDGETALLIDPFFTRPPLWKVALNLPLRPDEAAIRDGLKGVDHLAAVLVSHSHYDHALDAGATARLFPQAELLGSESTANIGRGAGLPESRLRVVRPGEVYAYGRFRVRFIASHHAGASGGRPTGDIAQVLHTPAGALAYKQGGTYSIVIEHPQGTVLHHGSAGFVPGALSGVRADTVFLGVALLDELEPYLRETVDRVQARRVVPVHWDQFGRPLREPLHAMPLAVNLPKFFRETAALRPQLEVRTLHAGQRVILGALPSAPATVSNEPSPSP
jgi:L-ascorbate metabolism protein UlaG (beta-lactamase superfamily)